MRKYWVTGGVSKIWNTGIEWAGKIERKRTGVKLGYWGRDENSGVVDR